jgi:hypothetical protein
MSDEPDALDALRDPPTFISKDGNPYAVKINGTTYPLTSIAGLALRLQRAEDELSLLRDSRDNPERVGCVRAIDKNIET